MLKIKKFRHIAVVVDNLEKMLTFYSKVLGFKLKRKFKIASADFKKGVGLPSARANAAHLSLPDSNLEIELFEFDGKAKKNPKRNQANYLGYRHIAFVIEDLAKSYKELKKKGIRFYSEPILVKKPKEVAGFRFVYFSDPEGNIIELNQVPKRRPRRIGRFV